MLRCRWSCPIAGGQRLVVDGQRSLPVVNAVLSGDNASLSVGNAVLSAGNASLSVGNIVLRTDNAIREAGTQRRRRGVDVRAGRRRALRQGEVLIEQSVPVAEVYCLLDGRLAVWLKPKHGAEKEIARLNAGEIVEEMPFVMPRRRPR
jgi:hypothetical protein